MSQRTARPGGYRTRVSRDVGPRVTTAQPLDVGPFHAFVKLGICEQPELHDLLIKVKRRGVSPTDLWTTLEDAARAWPPEKLLRRDGAYVLELPSNAEGERETSAAKRIHAAVKRHEEAAEELLLAFAEFCAGGLDQATRVHLNVAAAGVREAIKTLGLDIQRTTKGGRQLETFSENGPGAAFMSTIQGGPKLRRACSPGRCARDRAPF